MQEKNFMWNDSTNTAIYNIEDLQQYIERNYPNLEIKIKIEEYDWFSSANSANKVYTEEHHPILIEKNIIHRQYIFFQLFFKKIKNK